jgi:hypothetical protein
MSGDRVADAVVEGERRVEVAAVVLGHPGVVDLAAVDAVQQPAGLFGAFGRVLRQVVARLRRCSSSAGSCWTSSCWPQRIVPVPSSSGIST